MSELARGFCVVVSSVVFVGVGTGSVLLLPEEGPLSSDSSLTHMVPTNLDDTGWG